MVHTRNQVQQVQQTTPFIRNIQIEMFMIFDAYKVWRKKDTVLKLLLNNNLMARKTLTASSIVNISNNNNIFVFYSFLQNIKVFKERFCCNITVVEKDSYP